MKLSMLKAAVAAIAITGFVAACAQPAPAPNAEAPKAADAPKMETPPAAPTTVVDAALADPQFSTLVKALTAAGLVDTLKGAGPFTVFAPTDAAFSKIPAATLEGLLKPEKKADLTKILTMHVVPGRIMAADLANVTETPATVQGAKLTVAKDAAGAVSVGGAKVTQPDIAAGNGVIHVIDTVIVK
jgi:uncharacterized surface protein with fasciclin (FAS1) repeats